MERCYRRQAQLVAELRESEIDQRRKAERDMDQVDVLASQKIGDAAFRPWRGDDVAVAAGQGPEREPVIGDGRERAVMDEEDLDPPCPQPGNGLARVGEQAVAGAPALMPKPGDAQRLVHRVSTSSRSSRRKGRFCSSGCGMCSPGSSTVRPS